mmetsp:Transcript_13691/g.43267  ORF Transcript_13691/g.43267 Transcript_13691/m.43267 type:complete len:211 (+) Transcript_13691:773-1405(+)
MVPITTRLHSTWSQNCTIPSVRSPSMASLQSRTISRSTLRGLKMCAIFSPVGTSAEERTMLITCSRSTPANSSRSASAKAFMEAGPSSTHATALYRAMLPMQIWTLVGSTPARSKTWAMKSMKARSLSIGRMTLLRKACTSSCFLTAREPRTGAMGRPCPGFPPPSIAARLEPRSREMSARSRTGKAWRARSTRVGISAEVLMMVLRMGR